MNITLNMEKQMEKKLEDLRKNLFIEIKASGGLGSMPGTDGTIITKDNKIYNYHDYYRVPEYAPWYPGGRVPLKYISEGKEVKTITIKKLNNYAKKVATSLLLQFPRGIFTDAHFKVVINYNDQLYKIENNDAVYYKIMNIIEKNEDNFHCSSVNPAGYSVHYL